MAGLDSTLSSPPPSGSTIGEELAEVTLVLENQDQVLTALAEDLQQSDESGESTVAELDGGAGGGDSVSGSFETTLLTTGQDLAIEYELADLEPAISTSDAGLAQAEIVSSAIGELTLANAAEHRQSVELTVFQLVLFWRHSDVPSGAFEDLVVPPSSTERKGYGGESSSPMEGDPCRYEIEGERLCALARFAFEEETFGGERNAVGETTLRPDEDAGFGATESAAPLAVAEDAADSIADLIESRPPDVVQVIADDTGEDFVPACVEPAADPLPGLITLGLLDGGGDVIFESADTDPTAHIGESGYGAPPECYALVSGSA